VKSTGFTPFNGIQEAVDEALSKLQDPKVMVIPYGGVTFPLRS